MTAKRILAYACILIAVLLASIFVQNQKIRDLETQISNIELQIQIKSFIDELRIPSEALYYDSKSMRQIYEIRQQAYEKMQIKEILPYHNVYVKPVGSLTELSRTSNVLSKEARASYGLRDNKERNIYCPVRKGGSWTSTADASLEMFWLNQLPRSIGSFKFDSEKNYRLGKYYNEHPEEFEEVVKPWILRITRHTRADISMDACEILLKKGYKDEDIKEALRQIIERSPSKRHFLSDDWIARAIKLNDQYQVGIDLQELDLPTKYSAQLKQETRKPLDPDSVEQSEVALSQARHGLAATTVGKKALFAGGYIGPKSRYSNVIDIYDAGAGQPDNPNAWTSSSLSQGRSDLCAVTLGQHAFFAGGLYAHGKFSNVVDIYDVKKGKWATVSLSQARENLAGTTVGSKTIFAGGWNGSASNIADIYDSKLGKPEDPDAWTTAKLSQARSRLTATTVGNKAFFAGGETCGDRPGYCTSDVVDIYDLETGLWSTAKLSQPRTGLASASLGTKAFFAGGTNKYQTSKVVDIYDTQNDKWSTATLSLPRSGIVAVTVGNKVFFAGGSSGFASGISRLVVDIYDADLGEPDNPDSWSTATLSEARGNICGTSVDNIAMFAGGIFGRGKFSKTVDVFVVKGVDQKGTGN